MKKNILLLLLIITCLALMCSCSDQGTQSVAHAPAESTAAPLENESTDPVQAEAAPEPLPTHEPGPYFDGYDLHYADADGYDIVSSSEGFLTFNENGVFTTGDADVDAQLRAILEENVDPETQTRDEMLKTIYNYVVFGYGYIGGADVGYGETGWELEQTQLMLKRGKGNCYSYAALFAELARSLGYQAEAVSGDFRAGTHAWTEITIDGIVYISDAEYQACNDWNNSYFMMDEEAAAKNAYVNPNR